MLSTVAPLALLLSGSQLVSAATMDVAVGKDGKVFTPETMTAEVGDTIKFTFYPEAHTVTQSSLADPCSQLMDEETGAMGFDSGSMPVEADATEWPTMTLEVNSTDPIWIYCKPHCELGMVAAINAAETGDKSFDVFKENAMGGAASASAGGATEESSGGAGAASGSAGGASESAGAAAAGGAESAASGSAAAASAGAEASAGADAASGAASGGASDSAAAAVAGESAAAGGASAASGGLEASSAASGDGASEAASAAASGAASAAGSSDEEESGASDAGASAAALGSADESAAALGGASAGTASADPATGTAFTVTPVKAVYALGGLLGLAAAFV